MPDPTSPPVHASRFRTFARPAAGCLVPVLAAVGGFLSASGPGDPDQPDADPPAAAVYLPEPTDDPDMRPAGTARTDAGRPVPLTLPRSPRGPAALADAEARQLAETGYVNRLERTGPPSDSTNCLGWVFTGGRFWVERSAAERVLADNGYRPVASPRPGDLVVYRQAGLLVHLAVARAAGATPAWAVVEGKWGRLGVFRHPAADCYYGPEFEFLRSPRRGHLLAGLPPSPPADRPPPPAPNR